MRNIANLSPLARVSILLVIISALYGCGSARSPSPTITPAAQFSHTQALTLAADPTPTETVTPAWSETPSPAPTSPPTWTVSPTRTATFNPGDHVTATPAPKAQCPALDPAYTPAFPETIEFVDSSRFDPPILDALNRGTTFAALRSAVRRVATASFVAPGGKKSYYTDQLSERDLTGDGVAEVIFYDPFWLAVYGCQSGRYIPIFNQVGGYQLQISDLILEDLNRDGLPETVFRLFDLAPVNGQYFLYIYAWDGAAFENRLVLNREDWRDKSYPGAYLHGHATTLSTRLNPQTGAFDLVVRGRVICGPCFTAGPWRWFTDTFTWNGSGFQHLPSRLDPPVYRFQAIQDGDLEMWRGNLDAAARLYRQALEDQQLKGWSQALYEQQEDILRAEGAGLLTPTPYPADPDEYVVLSAYIRYRTMLLQAALGGFDDVREEYEAFQQAVPPGQPGSNYLALAGIFWNAYQADRDLPAACAVTRQYTSEHYEAILYPINDLWHGWQSPGHMKNPPDEQLICPFG